MENKKDKKLINMAKGKPTKAVAAIPPVPMPKKQPKVVEKKLTADEERDLKAKERIKNLLEDVPLSVKEAVEPEDLIEIVPVKNEGNIEWLEEQIALLTSENDNLKIDYAKIFNENQRLKNNSGVYLNGNDDSVLKATVIALFNELQVQYVTCGFDAYGKSNFIIVPLNFINRLITFFPFLQNEKKI